MINTENFIKGVLYLVIIPVMVLAFFGALVLFIILPLQAVNFYSDKAAWSSYEYKVQVDDQYYYTHAYSESNNCLEFIDNYNNQRKYCEKYQVGENYVHKGGMNLRVLFYGY